MIPVTRTHLPDIQKYQSYIDRIFESNWVTNGGPLVKELEIRLQKYLDVPHLVLVNNGTMALHLAYRLLNLSGRIITTPFSFVATTSSATWEGLHCDFADIDLNTLNMNHELIERMIRPETTAIVPVHVFGNACEIEQIQSIANRYELKVVYDAAHAFGVKYKGESILNFGDISTLSFHATKVFHTIEGGALIIKDPHIYQAAKQMINFGFNGTGYPAELGINAKMNEFQAAMGLCMLDEMEQIFEDRQSVNETYMEFLSNIPGITFPSYNPEATRNYSYFPLLLETNDQVMTVKNLLEQQGVFTRRYFYPSLDKLPFITCNEVQINSQYVTERILCLPMYDGLEREKIEQICETVLKCLR